MLLRAIPIDIVERIVILTETNRDYEAMCELIERLKEPQRRMRIIESITKREVDELRTVSYYLDGKLHRENDKPAVERADGTKEWWYNGRLHRENDKPAIECADGSKYWFYRGKLHRENDNPAIVEADGTKEWWLKLIKWV